MPVRQRQALPQVLHAPLTAARKEKLSINKAVVRLLEEATGAEKGKKKVVHHDLDRFFGTWTKEEADAFDDAMRDHRKIDPEMWK